MEKSRKNTKSSRIDVLFCADISDNTISGMLKSSIFSNQVKPQKLLGAENEYKFRYCGEQWHNVCTIPHQGGGRKGPRKQIKTFEEELKNTEAKKKKKISHMDYKNMHLFFFFSTTMLSCLHVRVRCCLRWLQVASQCSLRIMKVLGSCFLSLSAWQEVAYRGIQITSKHNI